MSDITNKQNLEQNINFLIAQRFFYSRAKKIRNIRFVISLLFAFLAPFIIYKWSNSLALMGLLGSLWAIIAYVIKKFLENENVNKASNIQEQFDTTLFNLPWNDVLVGNKISFELINSAKRKFKGDVLKLYDWYGNLDGFSYPVDVLYCQRSNLVWDWRLKKKYSIIIFFLIAVYFFITILLSVKIDLKLSEYIMGLFLPALSGYFLGIDEGVGHYKAYIKRSSLEKIINDLSDKAKINFGLIEVAKLRQIQDCIFSFRNGPLIPDWFYWFFRDNFEKDMVSALNNFKKQIINT